MPGKPVPEAELRAAVDAVNKANGNVSEAARSLGIPRPTLQHRVERAAAMGSRIVENPDSGTKSVTDPGAPDPGFTASIDKKAGTGSLTLAQHDKRPTEAELLARCCDIDPDCWRIVRLTSKERQVARKKRKADGFEVVTLYGLTASIERVVAEPVEDAVKALAERIKPLPKPPKRAKRRPRPDGQLAVLGIYDAHIGSLCWHEETGQDYTTEVGVRRAKNAIDDLVDELRGHPIDRLVMPIGNDLMHFDNARFETSSGNHSVDWDRKYPAVLVACHDVLAHLVDRGLEICDDIDVPLVAGNHDGRASLHLAHWLAQRYRHDKRVKVDTSSRRRKYRVYGGTLLGFMHGDRFNVREAHRIMAEEAAEHWPGAKCREWHTGDKHHRKQIDQTTLDTKGTVTFRINPSLASTDLWHYEQGFTGTVRCADVWRYTKRGLAGMATAYARDN